MTIPSFQELENWGKQLREEVVEYLERENEGLKETSVCLHEISRKKDMQGKIRVGIFDDSKKSKHRHQKNDSGKGKEKVKEEDGCAESLQKIELESPSEGGASNKPDGTTKCQVERL